MIQSQLLSVAISFLRNFGLFSGASGLIGLISSGVAGIAGDRWWALPSGSSPPLLMALNTLSLSSRICRVHPYSQLSYRIDHCKLTALSSRNVSLVF